MKIHVNNLKKRKTKEFWEKMRQSNDRREYHNESLITKYRFHIIATSETPDHPSNFGIGKNVEGQRGETDLQPIYRDGKPTHRLAGLLYVSLHSLKEIVKVLSGSQLRLVEFMLRLSISYYR